MYLKFAAYYIIHGAKTEQMVIEQSTSQMKFQENEMKKKKTPCISTVRIFKNMQNFSC